MIMKKIKKKVALATKKTLHNIKKFVKGFTIVELIVVISIIAVLSTIIVATINGQIARAKDGRVKGDIASLTKSIQMHKADAGTYTAYAVPSTVSTPCGESTYTLAKTADEFVIYHKLCSSDKYWCGDSTGALKELDAPPDDGVYNCISGLGGGGESGSDCEDILAQGVDTEEAVTCLMGDLSPAAGVYMIQNGSYDNMCDIWTNSGTDFAQVAGQLFQGSRMYGCKDPVYTYGWGGTTNGWVACIDFYDGLFNNGHYCADSNGFNSTTPTECFDIMEGDGGCR